MFDTGVFKNIKTAEDFAREEQEFELRKRQQAMQQQLGDLQLQQGQVGLQSAQEQMILDRQRREAMAQMTQGLGQGQDIETLLAQQAAVTGDPSNYIDYKTQMEMIRQKSNAELNALRERQKITGTTDRTSAFMADAQKLMEYNPNLSPMEAYALARGGIGQGTYFNPETNEVEALPGFAEARGDIKETEAFGSKFGESQGQAVFDLPRIRARAKEAIISIDRALQDPALENITGWLSTVPIVPGGERARAQAVMDQLGGLAFLAAYEELKGAGTITEIEGQKAESAISTIGTAQYYDDVVRGINDLRGVIVRGVESKEKAASQSADEILQDRFQPEQQTTLTAPENNQQIDEIIFNAKKAIKNGAPRNAVIQRLNQMGIDPVKAGI
jgi:hypothetical protein